MRRFLSVCVVLCLGLLARAEDRVNWEITPRVTAPGQPFRLQIMVESDVVLGGAQFISREIKPPRGMALRLSGQIIRPDSNEATFNFSGVAPEQLGEHVIPSFNLRFARKVVVVPEIRLRVSDQVTFRLPGGKMAVYTGLIPVAQNADAVAVVMGHEIAHALLRHGAQRMSQQKLTQIGQMAGAMSGMDPQQQQMVMAAMGYGYLLPYAREHETQADEVGLMLAAAACFNPQEAVPLWQRMSEASGGQAPPEFSSTHPNPGTRIQNLTALMPKAMAYRAKFCPQGAAQ